MLSYTINENLSYNSLEINFNEKPSEEIRSILKSFKFRWNPKRSIWYGFADRQDLENSLNSCKLDKTATNNEILSGLGGKSSDGYLGAIRWDGSKAGDLYKVGGLPAINKAIKKHLKKAYGVDCKTKYKSFSGGQDTTIDIMVNSDDIISDDEAIKLYESTANDYESHHSIFASVMSHGCWWDGQYNTVDSWSADGFNNKLVGLIEAAKEGKTSIRGWMVRDNLKEAHNFVELVLQSYNYDDSNGMVDYFDTNFYYFVNYKFNEKAED